MTTNVLSSAQTITSGRALATPAPSPSGLSVFRSLWALTRRGLTEASLKWFLVIGIALSSFATIFDASKFLSEIDSVALRLIRIGFSVLLVSTLWGATQVTTEFRDATVAARVTQHRGVGRLVAGHALASLPAGLLFGLIGALSSTIPTFVIFHQRDLSITMNEDLVSTVVGIIAVSALPPRGGPASAGCCAARCRSSSSWSPGPPTSSRPSCAPCPTTWASTCPAASSSRSSRTPRPSATCRLRWPRDSSWPGRSVCPSSPPQ